MPGSRFIPVALLLSSAFFPSASTRAASAAPAAQQAQDSSQLLTDFDLPGYEAELDRCSAALKHPSEISDLRRSLPPVWFVRTPDGRFGVSTTWLTQRLEKMEQEPELSPDLVKEIESRLTAMRNAAGELEAAVSQPSSNTNARQHLDDILQRSEFSGEQGPSAFDLWKARVNRWITEQLIKLLSRLHLGSAAGNTIAWTIVGLACIALCVWVFRSLAGRSSIAIMPADLAPDPTDSRLWAKDALAAAERGDYREAVHCAYWAAVVHLETLGLLKRDRARTPRESLRLLDLHPSEQTLLREFTRLFELIWYGYRPASAADWSNARTHLEKMGCLTPSTAATANS
jgi:hypothetical protein